MNYIENDVDEINPVSQKMHKRYRMRQRVYEELEYSMVNQHVSHVEPECEVQNEQS